MLNFDQSVFTSSVDNGFCSNRSLRSGPLVAFGSIAEATGSRDPLLGPDVSSIGSGTGMSASGISGAEALPAASFPAGTTASRGCAALFLGTTVGSLHVLSKV